MKISLEISKHADQKKDLVGVKRRQQQLVRTADFLPPVTFLVFLYPKNKRYHKSNLRPSGIH